MSEREQVKTYGALVATTVFWGLSFVATKVALESIPTFTLIFTRFLLAFIFFAVLMIRQGIPSFTLKDHVKLFAMAIFEPGLYFLCETKGLLYTSAAKVSLIIATIPVAVVILSAIILKEKTNRLGIIGILLSLMGIAILVTGDPDFAWGMGGSLKGDLIVFGAVLSAALYIVSARNLGKRYSSREITSMQCFYGAVFFAPALFLDLPTLSWAAISTRSIIALVYLTVFATVAAFLFYNYALTKIPASRASIFINGIPVVTALGAWIILGERLTILQGAGGFLVLAAVFITNLMNRRTALPSSS
ncbi:MAG TPA: EamA family transporter [Syntrophales bacterium]|nr:EamA family transporter [Syntrophales bacterium]HPQ45597.1 EamA family transporter [Syntrophales bacterium]